MKKINLLANRFRYNVQGTIVEDKDLDVYLEMDALMAIEADFTDVRNELIDYLLGLTYAEAIEVVQNKLKKHYEKLDLIKEYLTAYRKAGKHIITEDDLEFDIVYDYYMIESEMISIRTYHDYTNEIIQEFENK